MIFTETPTTGWYCPRCIFIQNDYRITEPPQCLFCPEPRGILIQLTDDPCQGSWVHVTCVNFLSFKKDPKT